MGLFLAVALLGIGFFICFVNMIFRKIECKNYSEWKKNSVFNSPRAWGIYATSIAIIIGVLFIVSFTNILEGFSSVGKQENTITQQQQEQDSLTQQQDGTSTEN
jgi:amino acid transporter